jgi:hypothetical protein
VPPANVGGVRLRLEPLRGKLADRLEHLEPYLAARGLGPPEQAVVDEVAEQVEYLVPKVGVTHLLDRLERAATGERRE